MKTAAKNKIRGNFDFIVPAIFPSLVQGKDAEALYNEVSKTIKSGVWYDENSKKIKGSSTFLAARMDSILRKLGNGIRVATLADLSRPEVMGMTKGDYYSDTPAIVFRTIKDDYESNSLLIPELALQIENKMGKLELPCLVTGFDVRSSKNKEGYGFDIVPRKDFAVLPDERLLGKYDGKSFSNVDENGLPIFDRKGDRAWFARDKGLSGLCLDGGLELYSAHCVDGLAGSGGHGRVVLVADVRKK